MNLLVWKKNLRHPNKLLTLEYMCKNITNMFKINQIINLQKHYLQFNLISSLDYEIDLLNLAYLNLSDNQISEIRNINTPNLIE